MANDRYFQFLYSKHPMLTMVTGLINIGATGSVGTVTGQGVYGVTLLTTGLYKIKLTQNFNALIGGQFTLYSGVTGSDVGSGSLVTGTAYQITAVGTTTWSSAGFDSDYTPAVGSVFVATGTAAGTGTAKALTTTGIGRVEIAQDPQQMLANNNFAAGKGASVTIQTLNASGSLANPTEGAQIGFALYFRNSSVVS